MSTFDGHIKEFPHIRIDYFRPSPTHPSAPAPLAYFLSHIHSDHLTGLDTTLSPFIYCSPATRDLLLRLEKYPHRMNFAKGILESRRQTYGHLRKLLKAIPLQTPTVVELAPGRRVRVSLFEANHCVGAVGFLIEGDGKAVFFSGDVRSEGWWVKGLCRSPLMVPYLGPGGRRLDCLYLDTTFATKGEGGRYREFPSKVEGLRELVEKVGMYPEDTVFYYDAWTFGYEDVWQALSAVLDTQVHLDAYRYGLYRALANGVEPKAPEAAKLMGFYCGNHFQEGCVTDRQTRLHSCECGTGCPVWNQDFVRITPIISRHNGLEMKELGAGGGKGDLNPKHELELGDVEMIAKAIEAYEAKSNSTSRPLPNVWSTISAAMGGGTQAMKLDVPALGLQDGGGGPQSDMYDMLENLPLDKLLPALAGWLQKQKQNESCDSSDSLERRETIKQKQTASDLPKQITFPYSRHSSYSELCLLIAALKPRDIHPCTVDSKNWNPSQSMVALFGHLYDKDEIVDFSHDRMMFQRFNLGGDEALGELEPWRPYRKRRRRSESSGEGKSQAEESEDGNGESVVEIEPKRSQVRLPEESPNQELKRQLTDAEVTLAWRKEVHDSALGVRGRRWGDVELVSVNGHQTREVEM